jgi:hypothetical protein
LWKIGLAPFELTFKVGDATVIALLNLIETIPPTVRA